MGFPVRILRGSSLRAKERQVGGSPSMPIENSRMLRSEFWTETLPCSTRKEILHRNGVGRERIRVPNVGRKHTFELKSSEDAVLFEADRKVNMTGRPES